MKASKLIALAKKAGKSARSLSVALFSLVIILEGRVVGSSEGSFCLALRQISRGQLATQPIIPQSQHSQAGSSTSSLITLPPQSLHRSGQRRNQRRQD